MMYCQQIKKWLQGKPKPMVKSDVCVCVCVWGGGGGGREGYR